MLGSLELAFQNQTPLIVCVCLIQDVLSSILSLLLSPFCPLWSTVLARQSRQALVAVGPEDTHWLRVIANRLHFRPDTDSRQPLPCVLTVPPLWEAMNLLTSVGEEVLPCGGVVICTLTWRCLGEALSNPQITKIKLSHRWPYTVQPFQLKSVVTLGMKCTVFFVLL